MQYCSKKLKKACLSELVMAALKSSIATFDKIRLLLNETAYFIPIDCLFGQALFLRCFLRLTKTCVTKARSLPMEMIAQSCVKFHVAKKYEGANSRLVKKCCVRMKYC